MHIAPLREARMVEMYGIPIHAGFRLERKGGVKLMSATTIPEIELQVFRTRLHDLRAEQVRDLDAANHTIAELTDQRAFADAAMLEVISHAKYMAEVTPDIIAEIDAALARMDAGTFGVCEGCGDVISLSRLMFRPYGRRCVDCNN